MNIVLYNKYDNIITSRRFDLMAKYLYVKHFNKKTHTDFLLNYINHT